MARAGINGNQSLCMTPSEALTSHEWLKYMERFAQKFKPFWDDMLARSKAALVESQGIRANFETTVIEDDVVVALIDDGVMALNEYLTGRVLEGETFEYHDGEIGPYYNSGKGHGTEMAKLVLRVCPMAKIYPIRLKTCVSEEGESKIELKSAALVSRIPGTPESSFNLSLSPDISCLQII